MRFSNLETLYEDESERAASERNQAVVKHIGASIDEVERLYGIVLKSIRQCKIKIFCLYWLAEGLSISCV
jgi:hypothetical protein